MDTERRLIAPPDGREIDVLLARLPERSQLRERAYTPVWAVSRPDLTAAANAA